MAPPAEAVRASWGTALALIAAVLLLAVLDAVPLVALPLALLLLALQSQPRWKTVSAGAAICLLILLLPVGSMGVLSRGWGLVLGSAFLGATLIRPEWNVLPRAVAALALALAAAMLGLALSGHLAAVDLTVQTHFREASKVAFGDLAARMPDSDWVAEFGAATERVALVQWKVFPAVLGLQSLAALALASWWMARFGGAGAAGFALRKLKEFRFSDQLIWLLIIGLGLVLIPMGDLAVRAGYNALVFMGGLYALRGLAVFVFLLGGAPTLLSLLLGVVATIFLYPLVLTAALLVGVGDTWLDVREKAAMASRS